MNEAVEIVRKNLDRILSLEPVYVLTVRNNRTPPKETYLRRYIGYVLNKNYPGFIPVAHYFLVDNKIRRFCKGDKFSVLDGRIGNYGYYWGSAKTIRNSNESVITTAKDWLILSSENTSNGIVFEVVDYCFTALGYVPEYTKTIHDR